MAGRTRRMTTETRTRTTGVSVVWLIFVSTTIRTTAITGRRACIQIFPCTTTGHTVCHATGVSVTGLRTISAAAARYTFAIGRAGAGNIAFAFVTTGDRVGSTGRTGLAIVVECPAGALDARRIGGRCTCSGKRVTIATGRPGGTSDA